MKSTESFKKAIQDKLNEIAANDPLFETNLKKEGKNIDDCITYIFKTVKESGCNGFTDDEVFGMAIHYYDEDNINVGAPMTCNVVVNHKVELSPEEIQQAKTAALNKVIEKESERLSKKSNPKKSSIDQSSQQSLF